MNAIIPLVPEAIGKKLPIHSVVDCGALHPSKWEHTNPQEEEDALLSQAFNGLEEHGISPFTTLWVFVKFRARFEKLALHFPERNTLQHYRYIWQRIAEGIQRECGIILETEITGYQSWAASQNMQILADTALGTTERRISTTDYPEELDDIYKNYWNPSDIRGKLNAMVKEQGKSNIHYLWIWRKAKWERRLVALRITEHMYVLENGLLRKDDKPTYC